MKRILCFLIAVLLLAACAKNETDTNNANITELNGRYRGTFNRTGMDTSNVEIIFRPDHSFEGTGGPLNYPAICSGTFQQNGTSLVVDDTCSWTANFDWSLIFSGNYSVSSTGGNSIRIWRTNGVVTDEYRLTQITR